MKRIVLPLLLLLAFAAPALATDFTVLPYPKNGHEASMDDWAAAVKDLQEINATGIAIMKTWRELEPEKGAYGLAQLGKDFTWNAAEGRKALFSLQFINTMKREVPPDLSGKDWDDPEMIARFQQLFAQMEKLGAAPPKFIALGNEVDIYFEKHPKEVAAFLKFYHRAAAAAQSVYPGARIGVTVTYEGLVKGRGEVIRQMIDAGEVAIFTYYPVIDLKPRPVENVAANLDSILAAAGNKDVVLQEAGYPSGAAIGSSEEKQALFYRVLLGALKERPQFRFASLFLLHDFAPKLCDDLIGYYGFEKAPQGPKAKFREFLCTLGLKKHDGTPKPAWREVRETLK